MRRIYVVRPEGGAYEVGYQDEEARSFTVCLTFDNYWSARAAAETLQSWYDRGVLL